MSGKPLSSSHRGQSNHPIGFFEQILPRFDGSVKPRPGAACRLTADDIRWCWTDAAAWGRVTPLGCLQRDRLVWKAGEEKAE